jgi:hypothetical protein
MAACTDAQPKCAGAAPTIDEAQQQDPDGDRPPALGSSKRDEISLAAAGPVAHVQSVLPVKSQVNDCVITLVAGSDEGLWRNLLGSVLS